MRCDVNKKKSKVAFTTETKAVKNVSFFCFFSNIKSYYINGLREYGEVHLRVCYSILATSGMV